MQNEGKTDNRKKHDHVFIRDFSTPSESRCLFLVFFINLLNNSTLTYSHIQLSLGVLKSADENVIMVFLLSVFPLILH